MPIQVFFDDFTELLEALNSMNCLLIIAGDVNIHLDDHSNQHSIEFRRILECFSLSQLVNGPTQKRGHQLEVIITNDCAKFSSVEINDVCLSDHYRINCSFQIGRKALSEYRTIQFREVKRMDKIRFSNHLRSKFHTFSLNDQRSFSSCISSYNAILQSSIDEFAPLKEKVIKDVVNASWFDEEYRDLRKMRRNAEKLWRKTKLTVHHLEFVRLRKCTTTIAKSKKRTKIRARIDKADGNQKALYSALNELTGQKQTPCYPDKPDAVNAYEFGKFFTGKVEKIREVLESKHSGNGLKFTPNTFESMNNNSFLEEFDVCTESEILDIIKEHGFRCSFLILCLIVF